VPGTLSFVVAADDAWLARLALPAHATILRRLVEEAGVEPAFRFIEVCCSVARGTADRHSDLDLGLGVLDAAWPDALSSLPGILGRLGEVVDLLDHRIAEWGDDPHRRYFVQYRDGVQVDLVVFPVGRRAGRPAGSIALYDPDGRLAATITPRLEKPTADDVREWAFLGWIALADLDKYLHRGSPWEALERLHGARTFALRLWAAGEGIPYPAFGLTSVLDEPGEGLPPGIGETVASLELTDLRRAGLVTAALLDTASAAAASATGATLPTGMRDFVADRLRDGQPG
jgi:hypothetical protein